MDKLKTLLAWMAASRTFHAIAVGVLAKAGAFLAAHLGDALSQQILDGVTTACGLAAAGFARAGGANDSAKALKDAKEHVAEVLPVASGAVVTRNGGRASLATLVSIAVILALASVLAGCVSQEAKDGLRQLDQDLADLDAHPDSPRGPALVHAMHGLADRECEAFSIPTATAR